MRVWTIYLLDAYAGTQKSIRTFDNEEAAVKHVEDLFRAGHYDEDDGLVIESDEVLSEAPPLITYYTARWSAQKIPYRDKETNTVKQRCQIHRELPYQSTGFVTPDGLPSVIVRPNAVSALATTWREAETLRDWNIPTPWRMR